MTANLGGYTRAIAAWFAIFSENSLAVSRPEYIVHRSSATLCSHMAKRDNRIRLSSR